MKNMFQKIQMTGKIKISMERLGGSRGKQEVR